jgi:hypothetical protein
MRRSKARALISTYKSVRGHVRAIERKTSCWKVQEDTGIEWDEEERKLLHGASSLFSQAQKQFDQVYSARIGKLVTLEIRTGDWRGSD